MDSKDTTVIVLHETILQSIVRDVGTLAMFVVLIGIGWLIDSNAMQWFGGLIAFIVTCGEATAIYNKSRHSLASARALLDDIEARNG